MAHVDRRPKAGGTTTYTTEVAAGFDLIRETEVDLDFSVIYGEFNGGIDDTNIREAASIDYSKLDLAGRIQPGDLAPGFHLPPGTIPPGGWPPGSYGPGSIDTPDLKPGAVIYDLSVGGGAPAGGVPILAGATGFGTEALIYERTFNVRSTLSKVFVIATIAGWMGSTSAITLNFLYQLRLDGPAGGIGGTVVCGHLVQAEVGGGAAPLSSTLVYSATGLSAGSHRITSSGQIDHLAANVLSYQIVAISFA